MEALAGLQEDCAALLGKGPTGTTRPLNSTDTKVPADSQGVAVFRASPPQGVAVFQLRPRPTPAAVSESVKPQSGVAVFQQRLNSTPSPISEPVKPSTGVAVFQTKTVAFPGGSAFSAPPITNWLGAGVAVFSTRTPIPVGSDGAAHSVYTAQPGTLGNTTTQRSRMNWGALLQGLQFGLAIVDGIEKSRQPSQGVTPPTNVRTGVGVAGVPTGTSVVPPPSNLPPRSAAPTPQSAAMCQDPAALANPHNVTQDGRNVIGSSAPSTYAPALVPCSQLKR